MTNSPKCDSKELNSLYAIYCDKMDVLFGACGDELHKPNADALEIRTLTECQRKVNNEVSGFRDEVHKWHQEYNYETAHNRSRFICPSHGSVGSSRGSHRSSSVQSLREKLAEQRAKRIAEKSFVKERDSLDQQMLDLKKKINKLELKKIKDIEENLEKEIVEMEKISLDGSQEHLLVNNNAQQFGSPTLDQQLKDVINRQN